MFIAQGCIARNTLLSLNTTETENDRAVNGSEMSKFIKIKLF